MPADPSPSSEKSPGTRPGAKYVPTWRERFEDWGVHTGPIVAAILFLGVLGWYVFAHLLPERSENRSAASESDALRDESTPQPELRERGVTPSGEAAQLKRRDEQVESIEATDLVSQIAARVRVAEQAAREGRFEEAAAGFSAADGLQRRLNTTFPHSRAVSTAKLEEFENRRQTALASPLFAHATALDREVTATLREGQVTGLAEKVSEATAVLRDIASRYPRSAITDVTLRDRAVFRWLKRDRLADIVADVRPALVALPEGQDVRIYSCEVSQSLYERLMNANPSREHAPDGPVECVTWHEARAFCERLSWLLGRRVRLPTEAEFDQLDAARTHVAWSAETSNGHAHPVTSSPTDSFGLHDVFGNVAEWLESTADAATAPVAGGSFIDARETIVRATSEAVDKRLRMREVGFRFVVETEPGPP